MPARQCKRSEAEYSLERFQLPGPGAPPTSRAASQCCPLGEAAPPPGTELWMVVLPRLAAMAFNNGV